MTLNTYLSNLSTHKQLCLCYAPVTSRACPRNVCSSFIARISNIFTRPSRDAESSQLPLEFHFTSLTAFLWWWLRGCKEIRQSSTVVAIWEKITLPHLKNKMCTDIRLFDGFYSLSWKLTAYRASYSLADPRASWAGDCLYCPMQWVPWWGARPQSALQLRGLRQIIRIIFVIASSIINKKNQDNH